MNECVYDENGHLVDDDSKYASCQGTPDIYGEDSPMSHTFLDPGGIAAHGIPAAASLLHACTGEK